MLSGGLLLWARKEIARKIRGKNFKPLTLKCYNIPKITVNDVQIKKFVSYFDYDLRLLQHLNQKINYKALFF